MENHLYKWQAMPPELKEFFPSTERFLWARKDERLHGDLHTLKDVDVHVMPLVKQRRSVIQAGGAMGVWAKRFAQLFENVYTFEPTPESFRCTVYNTRDELNVVAFNAALGHPIHFTQRMDKIHMGFDRDPVNYGGYHVMDGGRIPVMAIDDIGVGDCDLIFLDIEGYELFALQGAEKTIEMCHPIIVLEDKAQSGDRFGVKWKDPTNYLIENHGYRVQGWFHGNRDVVLVP